MAETPSAVRLNNQPKLRLFGGARPGDPRLHIAREALSGIARDFEGHVHRAASIGSSSHNPPRVNNRTLSPSRHDQTIAVVLHVVDPVRVMAPS
jgi:hypothetical protein